MLTNLGNWGMAAEDGPVAGFRIVTHRRLPGALRIFPLRKHWRLDSYG
jgi:hypothetical protein